MNKTGLHFKKYTTAILKANQISILSNTTLYIFQLANCEYFVSPKNSKPGYNSTLVKVVKNAKTTK